MSLSDAELVRAAQNGEAASLGVLLERHRAPLYALALGFLGNGSQAEDAVQDTFLVALRKIDRLREPEAVGGWLRAILRNVCLTRLRGGQREVLFGEPLGRLEWRLSEPSVEEAIDRLAMREWVRTALSEMSEPLRAAAMLRYFGGYYSYDEISAILGIPIGTVRSRLSQVKVKLAAALLKSAGLEHSETRRLTESRTRFFTAAFDEYNRGEGFRMMANALSDDDFAWGYSDGTALRGRAGRESLVYGLEEDSQDGVKLHPTNIIVGKDITVLEGDFENPPDDPFHCPPATLMVCFYRDGRIHRVRQYYVPRAMDRAPPPVSGPET
jgi:RNA polymerase sigma-70 factor (ECF subfamily)